jgi:Lon protease-like protein
MRARRLATAAILALLAGTAMAAQAPGPVRGADALPDTIPLFPLDDLMVFPNIERPLHIFEPRYRAMMADALAGTRIIGMVQLRPGYEADYEGRPPVHAVGCAGVITEFEQLPDGRYNLVLRGLVKFRILAEDQSRPYRLARVEAIPEEPDAQERAALPAARERLLGLAVSLENRPPREMSDEDVINALAQYLPIGGEPRQGLLEANGPLARARALIAVLEKK